MTTTIVDTIQEIVRHEMRALRVAELGLVEKVYPHSSKGDDDNYGCDVRLKNSGLLLKRVPIATGHIGTVAIPNVGDLVLLTFVNGDIDQPLVIGRMYNNEDRPPLNKSDEIIFRLPLAKGDDKTIKADIRNIKGNKPPREILVEMAPKITLNVNDGIVQATAGKTEMKLDQSKGSGKVTVVAGRTKITMNQDGDVTITAAGNMTLKAQRDLKLQAMNVTIKADMNAKLEGGMQTEVKGGIGATLKGGATTNVQGSITNIKGITSFSM